MNLNKFAADRRLAILEELKQGREPSQGEFDRVILGEAKTKGSPQLGKTRYEPDSIFVEFIYPDPHSSATVLTVKLAVPERIVFMPVPEWVVETIWQGDIDGSYHFESEARRLLATLQCELDPEENVKWFGPRQPRRRE